MDTTQRWWGYLRGWIPSGRILTSFCTWQTGKQLVWVAGASTNSAACHLLTSFVEEHFSSIFFDPSGGWCAGALLTLATAWTNVPWGSFVLSSFPFAEPCTTTDFLAFNDFWCGHGTLACWHLPCAGYGLNECILMFIHSMSFFLA